MGKMKTIDITDSERDMVATCRFDDTTGFGDEVVETERGQTRAAPKHRAKPDAASAETSGMLDAAVKAMDLCDPADVARLAARYEALNGAMMRMAREEGSRSAELDVTRKALERAQAETTALRETVQGLESELGHARDKVAIVRANGRYSLRKQVMCNVLTLGGAGTVLLFVAAFLYY